MTASSTATARSPEPLPRSRSRGGSGAGSSDRPPVTLKVPAGTPGRRNPRAARPFADIDTPESLAVTRSALTAQRTFRIQQLQQLDAFPPDTLTDPRTGRDPPCAAGRGKVGAPRHRGSPPQDPAGQLRTLPPVRRHDLRAPAPRPPDDTPVWTMSARHSRAHRRRPGQPSTGSPSSRDRDNRRTYRRLRRDPAIPTRAGHDTSSSLRGEHHRDHGTGA